MDLYKTPLLRERMLAKGNILVHFLNKGRPATTKSQQIVIDLLEHCQALEKLLPTVAKGRPVGKAEGASTLLYDLSDNREASKLVRNINDLLQPIRFRRLVPRYLLVDEGRPPAIQTHAAAIRPVALPKRERELPIQKEHAIELVLDLAETDGLARMRPCPVCGQWYMAHRPDQRYCSPGPKGCSGKKYRQKRQATGEAADYQKYFRKKERLTDKIRVIASKQEEGLHLTKPERTELAQLTRQLELLENQRARRKSHAEN